MLGLERNDTGSTVQNDPTADRQARLPRFEWRRGVRWFAAEFLVVVTGILVALAVQSWWNDRSERIEERALLRSLRAEFVSNTSVYDKAAARQRGIIEKAQRVLQWTGPQPPQFDVTNFETLVWSLSYELPTFNPARSEFEAMLGSGKLGVIRNQRLRAKLAEWPAALEDLRYSEDAVRDEVVDYFYPYLLPRIPLMNLDRSAGRIKIDAPSRFKMDYTSLLTDVQFENHVENRWLLADDILKTGQHARTLMDEVVALIDSELESSDPG